MKTKLFLYIILACLVFAGPAAAGTPAPLEELSNLTSEIKEQQNEEQEEAKKHEIRLEAIEQAAVTMAIQEAVKYRYGQINALLKSMDKDLDKLDFSLLLIHSGKVMPPVLREAKQVLQIKSANHSISSQHVYQILQPEKIVASTPTWRQYLIRHFNSIEEVNQLLLPKTDYEQAVWKKAVAKGWKIGIRQAESEFNANWNRFVRDFMGLITYHRLALQGVISIPEAEEGKIGVKVRGQTLDIDQRVFRIITPTKFKKVDEWTPIIHSNKNHLPIGG